jgi:DNA-binding MarR family transcriptional regulator
VTLGEYGEMTGKAIGAHTHMHKTKVSRAVAQLERRKLVTRRTNREDLREAFLALTPAGRAVYAELAPRAIDFMERLVQVVAAPDRGAFDRAMADLTRRSTELVAETERNET